MAKQRVGSDIEIKGKAEVSDGADIKGESEIEKATLTKATIEELDARSVKTAYADTVLTTGADGWLSPTIYNPNTLESVSDLNGKKVSELIEAEAQERKTADDTLSLNVSQDIEQITSKMSEFQTNVSQQVSAMSDEVSAVNTGILNEKADRENEDMVLKGLIESEAAARSEAITTIKSEVESDISNVQNTVSELSSNLSNEIQTRQSADSELSSKIENETAGRTSADTELQSRISALGEAYTKDFSELSQSVQTALDGKAPTSHASASTTYGVGTSSSYGHVKMDTTVSGSRTDTVISESGIKDFVNSSISTNTANYISNNGEPFTSASSLPTSGVTNNDYAIVTGTDSNGNTYYDRYKATVSGTTVTWAKEYRLNNSSFTEAEWNAIDSGLSSADKTKLNGIESGAEVNVQADWSVTDTTSDAYIKNKPTIPTVPSITVSNGTAESGKYVSAVSSSGHTLTVTKATLPSVSVGTTTPSTNQVIKSLSVSGHTITPTYETVEISKGTTSGSGNVVSDITVSGRTVTLTKGVTALTSHQDISGKADKTATVSDVSYNSTSKKIQKTINGTTSDVVTLSTVATSGSYSDLSNRPTIPTVNNATLTIQKNGTSLGTFTANQSSAKTINVTVPTAVSELTNDSGYLTSAVTSIKGNAETTYRTGQVNLTPANIGAQPTLTAGSNITISNNTISATNTTYTAGTNVSINSANVISATDTTYSAATTSAAGLMSASDKTKLDGIATGAQVNTVTGVKGNSETSYRTGNINITASNIGLGNVNNTSDSAKPVSTATQTALNGKAPTSHSSSATTYGVSTDSLYGHSMASSTTPEELSLAGSLGSETGKFARGDHSHPHYIEKQTVTIPASTTPAPFISISQSDYASNKYNAQIRFRVRSTIDSYRQSYTFTITFTGIVSYIVGEGGTDNTTTSQAFRYIRVYTPSSTTNLASYGCYVAFVNGVATAHTVEVTILESDIPYTLSTSPTATDPGTTHYKAYSTQVYNSGYNIYIGGYGSTLQGNITGNSNTATWVSLRNDRVKAGEAITVNQVVAKATNGLYYIMKSRTDVKFPCPPRIMWCATAYSSGATMSNVYDFIRGVTTFPQTWETKTIGYPVYARGTSDGAGNFTFDGNFVTSLTNGYTYIKVGDIGAVSTQWNLNAMSSEAFTLDSSGNITQINCRAVAVDTSSILLSVYPVGSIYMSVTDTNPGTLFGGTWEAWGSGKVPVGIDTSDSDFSTVEATGGEKTHTLTVSEMPSHTHTQNSHTHTQVSHNHGLYSNSDYTSNTNGLSRDSSGYGSRYIGSLASSATSSNDGYKYSGTSGNQWVSYSQPEIYSATATNQNTGGSGSHNNLQPYITCYMWKRTA